MLRKTLVIIRVLTAIYLSLAAVQAQVQVQGATPEKSSEQEAVFNTLAQAAYDRGAYYFFPQYIDQSWPIIWAEVEEKPSIIIYDTGASSPILMRERFDAIALDDQPDIGIDVPLRAIEPVDIKLHLASDRVNFSESFDIAWSSFGFPDYVQPFFDGVIPQLYWKKTAAAFERHPEDKWFAFFPSPHDPKFGVPFEIKLDAQQATFAFALVTIKLPGKAEEQTVRLLVDTGHSGDITLKSNLFDPGVLPAQKVSTGFGAAGRTYGWYQEGVNVRIGGQNIELNSVDIVDEINALHPSYELDGILGADFLNRFNHVIDMAAGLLTLELDGADFRSTQAYRPGAPDTAPHHNWNGAIITDPRDWADAHGAREADIIASVNGEDITPARFSTMLRQALDTRVSNNVCVYRPPENDENRWGGFCFDTLPLETAQNLED